MSAELSMPMNTANHQRRSSKRNFQRILAAFVMGLIACQSIGCCGTGGCNRPGKLLEGLVDRQIACYRDRVWAERAYNLRYGDCERPFGNHYRTGFIDGYCNVCDGEEGYVPAMPPQCYWGSQYQCAEGAKCVNAWFEGFPAGAQAAKKDSAGSFKDVYISNMINAAIVQDKAKNTLPSEIPINEADPSMTPPPATTAKEHTFMSPPASSEYTAAQPELEMPKSLTPLPVIVQPASYDESMNR